MKLWQRILWGVASLVAGIAAAALVIEIMNW